MNLWQTWNCWRKKFIKLKITSKSGQKKFLAFSMNKLVSKEVRHDTTKAIECLEDYQGTGACTHYLRIRKNQLIDSFQHLERYTNTLAVFGFNNSLFDIKFFKSYLIPYQPSFINEQEIEHPVIKKASDIFSFKHRDIRLLDNMTFLCGATRLNSFQKLTKPLRLKKALSILVV